MDIDQDLSCGGCENDHMATQGESEGGCSYLYYPREVCIPGIYWYVHSHLDSGKCTQYRMVRTPFALDIDSIQYKLVRGRRASWGVAHTAARGGALYDMRGAF